MGKLDCWGNLLEAARRLREAQRDYMEHRGDEARGKIVAECAGQLDAAIEDVEKFHP